MVYFEAEMNMPYVTSIERRATQRGLEQGLEQGVEKSILHILARKFGQVPPDI
jgi:hypothetical protein